MKMKQQIDLSLVIPVFDEAENLEELVRRCLSVCRELDKSFEIILVDDGSEDGSTAMIAEAARRKGGEIIGILLNRNYGQHAAIFAGFARSRGKKIITLDADLQNPPEEIPKLLKALRNNIDVVGTIRTNRNDSLFRKLSSSLVNSMVRRATGVNMHDYGCMLRGYRRHIVEAMLTCREHSTFIPILANSFARYTAEIPVSHAARSRGDSKYSLFKLVSLQFDLLTSMSTFPLRLLSLLGALIAGSGMIFSAFLLTMRFFMGAAWAAQGVFTLFAILFVFIGALLLGMGLLGEYIGRIYQDVRARPRYFIQEVVTGTVEGLSPRLELSGYRHLPDTAHPHLQKENIYENSRPCLS